MRVGGSLEGELTFRHWIAISMKNGFVRGRRLYPADYALLMFSKGDMSAFERPRIEPQRRRRRNLVKDYGGYTGIITEKGINLSDFSEDQVQFGTPTKEQESQRASEKVFRE